MPNRRQAIIWNNVYPTHWRIYKALGRDELQWNLYKATTEFRGLSRQVVSHGRENKHDFVKTVSGKLWNLCVFSKTYPVSLYRFHCNRQNGRHFMTIFSNVYSYEKSIWFASNFNEVCSWGKQTFISSLFFQMVTWAMYHNWRLTRECCLVSEKKI